ncbi:hypothetical protein C7J99_21480 [Brevibacillus brevis]|nr:hypothetical protein C7J99_21480 [Brevibacillus brevis]GEC93576.1 hypothetical protein BBR01nite_59070 [Brevibacillus brevis]
MVNKEGVLLRVLNRLKIEQAMEVIQEKFPGWTPEKKPKKKADIQEKFLALAEVIREDEIEDFVQMAVMKKNVGLPAYTYKVLNTDFLDGLTSQEIEQNYFKSDFRFNGIYTFSTEAEYTTGKLELKVRLKEFDSSWRTGANDVNSLSAVYLSNVTLDIQQKVLTINSGNHQVQEEIVFFLKSVFKWPLQTYRVREITNQIYPLGSVSYKTAVLLDLIHHRLMQKGINSTFKEIKFDIGSKRKDGIRDVAIGGRALLSSQLACEYITMGSNIVYFKVEMQLDGYNFSTKVYLKGQDTDILKIVIVDTDNEAIKRKAMKIIQNEYIDMCATGISNMQETTKLLESIKDRFVNKDQLITRAIKDSALKSIEVIASVLYQLDDQDERVVEALSEFIDSNRTILDSVGYDDPDANLDKIIDFAGVRKEAVVDEEDYQETEGEE